MYEVLNDMNSHVMSIRISGRLGETDCERLQPWLKQQIATHKSPSLMVLMDDFEGWKSVGALLDDVKHDATYDACLRQVAIVGDRIWQKWATRMAAPFSKADVRYFEIDSISQARAWLTEH